MTNKPDDVLTNERLELSAVRFQFRAGEIWRVANRAPAERYGAPSGTGFIWTDVTSGVWLCDVGDELEAIPLSRRQSNGSSGMVKGLEWRDNGSSRNGTSKCADTPFGLYDYSKYGANWAVYGQGTLIAEPEDEQGCIAAAQADFETRVRSCLAIQPVSGDGK